VEHNRPPLDHQLGAGMHTHDPAREEDRDGEIEPSDVNALARVIGAPDVLGLHDLARSSRQARPGEHVGSKGRSPTNVLHSPGVNPRPATSHACAAHACQVAGHTKASPFE